MYLLIISILSLSSFYELSKNKSCRGDYYFFLLSFLTLVLCFRYAQGADYFNYLNMYQSVDKGSSFFENTLYHGEIGWYCLLLIGKKLGLSFDGFIIVLSFLMMRMLYKALKMSPYKLTSLLIFFPTYYLTYCFSALRQGLAVCLFLGVGLKLLLERKYLKYYLLILALTLIHSASIILVTAPLIIKTVKIRFPVFVIASALLCSIAVSRIPFLQQVSAVSTYLEMGLSIGGILIRLILVLIILRLHRMGRPKDSSLYRRETVLVQLYYAGFILFCLTAFSGLISQRMTMPFKAIEVILIPLLIYRNRHLFFCRVKLKLRHLAFYFSLVILMMNVECVKNLYSYIEQQDYNARVTPLNYPYISIFNKEDINKYTAY